MMVLGVEQGQSMPEAIEEVPSRGRHPAEDDIQQGMA